MQPRLHRRRRRVIKRLRERLNDEIRIVGAPTADPVVRLVGIGLRNRELAIRLGIVVAPRLADHVVIVYLAPRPQAKHIRLEVGEAISDRRGFHPHHSSDHDSAGLGAYIAVGTVEMCPRLQPWDSAVNDSVQARLQGKVPLAGTPGCGLLCDHLITLYGYRPAQKHTTARSVDGLKKL